MARKGSFERGSSVGAQSLDVSAYESKGGHSEAFGKRCSPVRLSLPPPSNMCTTINCSITI